MGGSLTEICVQVFNKLIADWCGANQEEDEVGQHSTRSPSSRLSAWFSPVSGGEICCRLLRLQPSFNFRDAKTVSLFGETVTAQKLMFEKCGHDLRTHLATRVLPAVDCPPNIADHICLHIQLGN